MGDLFLALGYDDPRFNIHKTGREVDITARHRSEPRIVVAECKATDRPSGGDAINKFVGVLDAEQRRNPDLDATGYFISIAGFTESAIEQEQELGQERVLLFDSERVINELVGGRVLVEQALAIDTASRQLHGNDELRAEPHCELVAHQLGWFWIVYFRRNRLRSQFAIVHADGDLIDSDQLANQIVAADKEVGGELYKLKRIGSKLAPSKDELESARLSYFEYIHGECGEFTVEGLPVDQEAGSRSLAFEEIYVPLHLERTEGGRTDAGKSPWTPHETRGSLTEPAASLFAQSLAGKKVPSFRHMVPSYLSETVSRGFVTPHLGSAIDRSSIGSAITNSQRIAVVGPPGSGKSTMLKRFALAYAFPDRRDEFEDDLPQEPWLPLLVRCREVLQPDKTSIEDVLSSLSLRAEMSENQRAFHSLIQDALHRGDVLLLIDGLDEISEDGIRLTFVKQLRTFIARYPLIKLVITSREASFRIVGAALSPHSTAYHLAEFDQSDIHNCVRSWHRCVVGESEAVTRQSRSLSEKIFSNDRLRQLAGNPLLLTTLLMVKRWVGELPTRRSVLYGKAIEVLLMTWNVEAHSPLDPDEIVPQLAYVAHSMMNDGVQQITGRELKRLLHESRQQMPEILGFAEMSVSQFVHRVELRSSLLALVDHRVTDGKLEGVYQFRHLTFQEYLAALAISEGFYKERRDDDTVLSKTQMLFFDPQWKEVIPLTAVLSGRRALPLVTCILEEIQSLHEDSHSSGDVDLFLLPKHAPHPEYILNKLASVNSETSIEPIKHDSLQVLTQLLAQLILDEVQIPPSLMDQCLGTMVREAHRNAIPVHGLMRGKFGSRLLSIAERLMSSSQADLFSIGVFELVFAQSSRAIDDPKCIDDIVESLNSEDADRVAKGALAVWHIMDELFVQRFVANPREINAFDTLDYIKIAETLEISKGLKQLFKTNKPFYQFAAALAVGSIARCGLATRTLSNVVFSALLQTWGRTAVRDVWIALSWAISHLPLPENEKIDLEVNREVLTEKVRTCFRNQGTRPEEVVATRAAVVVAYLLKEPSLDMILQKLAVESFLANVPGLHIARSDLPSALKVDCIESVLPLDMSLEIPT